MNENLNLVEILKGVPKGTKLWCSICGECTLQYIDNFSDFPITCLAVDKYGREKQVFFTKYGRFYSGSEFTYGECVLFPSKDNRDWSTFNNGFSYVDLGLPSKTLWATMNVGADKPTDFGLYFQWGDTKGYTSDQIGLGDGQKKFAPDWSDYKWLRNDAFTKYRNAFVKYKNSGLVLDILDLEDDAANVNMGGDWHIPTPSQIYELINETTSDWIKMDNVNGRLFTSKKNGKSIFIPAAGYAWYGSLNYSGSYGYVWSSMLNTVDVFSGQYLGFDSTYVYCFGDSNRYYGLSVRGVLDKPSFNISDSHKHFELNDKVLVGIAFNGHHIWGRDIYLRYDEDKKGHCTFYESSVPDSLIIPYDIDKEGKEVPFSNIMSSLLDNNENRPKFKE